MISRAECIGGGNRNNDEKKQIKKAAFHFCTLSQALIDSET